MVKAESISLRSGTRQECPLLPLLFNILAYSLSHSPSHSNQTRKRNKRNQNWKERSKTVTVLQMFADVIILYVENPKDTSKKTVTASK